MDKWKVFWAVLVATIAVVYGVSPIDLVPELVTGPIGLVDDVAVIAAGVAGAWKLISSAKQPKGVGD